MVQRRPCAPPQETSAAVMPAAGSVAACFCAQPVCAAGGCLFAAEGDRMGVMCRFCLGRPPHSPAAHVRRFGSTCGCVYSFALGVPVLDEESCEGCHGYVHGLMLPHETLQDTRPVIDTSSVYVCVRA